MIVAVFMKKCQSFPFNSEVFLGSWSFPQQRDFEFPQDQCLPPHEEIGHREKQHPPRKAGASAGQIDLSLNPGFSREGWRQEKI